MIRIYCPEGSLPHTENVACCDAASHVAANDQHSGEAKLLLAYHAGAWDHWTETDCGVTADGIDWAEYEYDHDAAKRSIRSGWDTAATYGSTYPDDDGTGACDVEVQVGECDGCWYVRTSDDAGGRDECAATAYDSEADARAAAEALALEMDECDGMSAADWLERQEEALIDEGKAVDGDYVLAHEDGSRWDADRYSDRTAAESAIARWHAQVQGANPGTDIIWHLMDCPVLGRINDDGTVEIVNAIAE